LVVSARFSPASPRDVTSQPDRYFDVARANVERGQPVARGFRDPRRRNGLPDYNAQVFVFFVITVAAAEVAVGLALLVALYRARQTTDVGDITSLKF
jgi:hypothetical protein